MPLLTSPIDGAPMRQIKRYGIEIDVCPTSGGIWLDRGELEKLMALLQDEVANTHAPAAMHPDQDRHNAHNMPPQGGYYRRDDDDDDDDDDHRRYAGGGHGGSYQNGYPRKGKMSRIMDIFDF
jgi:hypothetical protein